MWQERLARYLLPGDLESDPGFRAEIERLGYIGIQVVGCVEVLVTAFLVVSHLVLDPSEAMAPYRITMGAAIIFCGLVTLALSRVRKLYSHARLIGSVSGLITAGILTWFLLRMTQFDPTADDFVPGNITLIMLVAVTALPLRPTDTLVFGFVLEATYVTIAYVLEQSMGIGPGVDAIYVLFVFVLTCLAAALSAVLYNQRRSSYEWHVSTLQAAENLRQAENRNLLAQNAASVGRLAAALSHEINSPLGALISGVDTLLLLASRQATSVGKEEQQRLVVLQNELRKSIRTSTDRLREIVARMQRFTNLDKAEIQAANINDILADVTALVEPAAKTKGKVELQLEPVPPLVCRPQQLSAVFSNLLGNALEAIDGAGRVVVSTRQSDSTVEVAIEDTGRGLDPEQVGTIFDPGFKVTQGRVSTGNWNMFSSRQIIREHGGEIEIVSEPGKGTRVRVVLPAGEAGLVAPT